MSQSREYEVQGASPEIVESQVQAQVANILQRLSTDPAVRAAATQKDAELLAQFDQVRDELAKSGQGVSVTSLVAVQNKGAGIEPGTVVLLVTLGPPIIEHFAAPMAVHICSSIWDKFILPELQRVYKKFRST